MRNLFKIVLLSGFFFGLNACDSVKDKLDNRKTREEIIYISENDTYSGYAKRVKEQYPIELKGIRNDELWMYISEMNNSEPLIYYKNKPTTVTLPVFD